MVERLGLLGRYGRSLVGVFAFMAAVGFLAAVAWKATQGSDLTTVANLVTVVGSFVSAFIAIAGWHRPQSVDVDALETARRNLARTLLGVYRDERKNLLGNDFKAIDVGFRYTPERGRNAENARPTGSFDHIADYYRQLHPRRMVITGAPGSGKTLLVIELAIQLLEDREADDPVPFKVSLATWDTAVPFADWIVEELSRLPECPRSLAAMLVHDRSILPVLDGLDEMVHEGDPSRRSRAALITLNETERGEALVLTCRRDEYDAMRASRCRLQDCAPVDLQDVPPHQAREYLEARAYDVGLWREVLHDLDQRQSGVLATTLTTPWLLTMVSTVAEADGDTAFLQPFLEQPAQPAALSAFEHELLPRYLASVTALHALPGGGHYDHGDVRRWSSRLAGHLRETGGRVFGGRLMSGREITLHELWPIAGNVLPRMVTAAITVALWVPAFVSLVMCLDRQGHFPQPGAGILLLLALLPSAAVLASAGHWPQPRRVLLGNLVTARGIGRVACAAALGTVLAANGAVAFTAGFGVMYGAGFALVFGLGLAVSVRSDIHLKAALSAALAVGLAGGAGAGVTVLGFGAFAGLVAGLAGGALALVVAVHVGIALARRRGGGLPDQDEPGLPSPDSALRNDAVAGVVAGAITGAIAFAVSWRASWLSAPLPLAVLVGASAFLAAGPGFTSAVSRRYLALLLCSRRHLPWRLTRFMRWARTAGILRIASTTYQFRHDRLLQWLGR
ncbi:NACHT domain-containing protein [Streptomyces sp. NPDC001700]